MEQQISFVSRGKTLRGWSHIPEKPGRFPAVVLCHGFTGNCSEHGLFEGFAQVANAAGLYGLRFDCAGSRARDGRFRDDTCLSGWRQDMIAAMDFAAAQPEVDGSRMAAMGISMGAAAAMLTLIDPRVLAAAGWATVLYPDEVFRKITGEENWEKLGRGEYIHHEYAEVIFDAAPCLRQDAERISVEQTVRDSGKPVLLRFGTADPVVDVAFADRMAAYRLPDVAVQVVEGENHGFQMHKQENIEETVAFLRQCLMGKE